MLGQGALSQSLAGEMAAVQLRRQIENTPASLKWGDLKVLIQPSLSMTWNDNVRYLDLDKQSDIILRPSLGLQSVYPISQYNALRFSLGVGYDKYLDHSEYDRLVVEPGSELAFEFFVKDFRINLHERFSYQNDAGRLGALSGVGSLTGMDNTVGPTITWDLKDVILTLGYNYTRFVSNTEGYQYLDRNSHQLLFRSGFQVHPAALVGVEVSGGPTAYDLPYLNDNLGVSAGVYAQWQISEHMLLQPRAGYTLYKFTENFLAAPADFTGYYCGIAFNHDISQSVSYSLDAGREIQPGTYSNLQDLWSARGRVTWKAFRKASLYAGGYFEDGVDSFRFTGDTYTRVGLNFGTSYRLMEKLTARLDYSRILKQSERAYRDYTQNSVTLTLTYRF